MPDIDVTDVVLGSEVAGEWFRVVRRVQVVDEDGISSVTQVNYSAVGSIAPVGDNSLLREESFETMTKSIKVITTFRLRGPSNQGQQTYQPDIIIWKGDSFVVRVLNDWSQYGVGMIEAECSSEDFIDQAPDWTPPS